MNGKGLGYLAIKNGHYQEAMNLFKRLIDRGELADGFLGYGIANYHLGDYPAARWAFYKTLDSEPANAEARRYIGVIEGAKKNAPEPNKKSVFRARKDYLEIYNGRGWRRFFIKGVNLGLGLPGYFPGEYAIKKATYLKWFKDIRALGVNTVRTYTLHPPGFYEALHEFNKSSAALYLLQGIWVEFPEDAGLYGKAFIEGVRGDIRNVIDALYGNAVLPERPGYAHGAYARDVSAWTMGILFGHEWESCAVKGFNERMGRITSDFKGRFLTADALSPFEKWVVEQCDYIQEYERKRYSLTRPVSTINWPTLDPLDHPSESRYEDEQIFQFGAVKKAVCSENEDMETLDLTKVRALDGAGFFASYHVYPYYPDFMNNDYPDSPAPYAEYLKALKKKHGDQPVLIAEFGVPSSREVAHYQASGWTHGGHDDKAQGRINSLMMRTIKETGMAGGALFSWFDEWFKKNWMFSPYELPPERKPLWFNAQDPEENYGLMAAYPGYPKMKATLSGRAEEWGKAGIIYEKDNGPLFGFSDGADQSRTLKMLQMQHDEGFLYMRLETKGAVDFNNAAYLIGLDTCGTEAGEFMLPYGTEAMSPVGLEFLISLSGRAASRILVCHSYDKYLNSGRVRPLPSSDGAWVVMQNKVSSRRMSKDLKRFYPARVYSMSPIRFGSLSMKSRDYDSRADFFFSGSSIELRIPWGLINVADPSSKTVLWADKNGRTRKTEGIKTIAVSYKPQKNSPAAEKTGHGHNITDALPQTLLKEDAGLYSWEGWDTPAFHTYLKQSYFIYKKTLSDIPDTV